VEEGGSKEPSSKQKAPVFDKKQNGLKFRKDSGNCDERKNDTGSGNCDKDLQVGQSIGGKKHQDKKAGNVQIQLWPDESGEQSKEVKKKKGEQNQ